MSDIIQTLIEEQTRENDKFYFDFEEWNKLSDRTKSLILTPISQLLRNPYDLRGHLSNLCYGCPDIPFGSGSKISPIYCQILCGLAEYMDVDEPDMEFIRRRYMANKFLLLEPFMRWTDEAEWREYIDRLNHENEDENVLPMIVTEIVSREMRNREMEW